MDPFGTNRFRVPEQFGQSASESPIPKCVSLGDHRVNISRVTLKMGLSERRAITVTRIASEGTTTASTLSVLVSS